MLKAYQLIEINLFQRQIIKEILIFMQKDHFYDIHYYKEL
jgi:hypothetical protein